jgi:hypothetical protein
MDRVHYRKILNHIYEVQKIIYEMKKCERTYCKSCKACDYSKTCEALTKLLSAITHEA